MLFRRPLHEIATWPAAELLILKTYLDYRPAPEERIELMLAQGHAITVNQFIRAGATPKTLKDFLLFTGPWPEPQSQFATDRRAAIQKFRSLSARIQR